MRILVTQKHIDRASHSCRTCPVALALEDATGVSWSVNGTHARRGEDMLDQHQRLPDKVREWISTYDGGHEVKPFHFEWDPIIY